MRPRDHSRRMDVWINWGAIAEMFGWTGSIEELKKVPVEDLPRLRQAAIKSSR